MKIIKVTALLLCMLLFAGMMTACQNGDEGVKDPDSNANDPIINDTEQSADAPRTDAEIEGVDFSSGKIGFLDLYLKPIDSSEDATLELAVFKGENAAKINPAKGVPYIIIDAWGLLGPRITELHTVEIGIGAENSSGRFRAISGEIFLFRNWNETDETADWSVFIDKRNPNVATMTLARPFNENDGNLIVVSRKQCVASDIGQPPSDIFITRIGFRDRDGNYLPVNEARSQM